MTPDPIGGSSPPEPADPSEGSPDAPGDPAPPTLSEGPRAPSASAPEPRSPRPPMDSSPVDPYDHLLRATRNLRREHAAAREAWFSRLAVDRKEDLLFELEVLLKGLACFANPRNHPGPTRRAPVVSVDFRERLLLVQGALARIVSLCKALLADGERAFVFQRYLETVLPDDGARTKLVRDAQGEKESPERSLFVLRHAMTNLLEVTAGLVRLNRVPYRLFLAHLSVAQREVTASAYFNPLNALEFRPEFDRITNPQMLDLMRSVPGDHARRLVALTFLSLFRMLRYLALLESSTRADGRRGAGPLFLVMSVLRSDARALIGYLRKNAGPLLASSYERDIFRVDANEIAARFDGLVADGHKLLSTKATLEGIAANVRLEMRRTFEHDFHTPDRCTVDEARASVQRGVANLRPALQSAILFLGRSLGTSLEARVFDDAQAARRLVSERQRRDVWMFSRIVRAFASKGRAMRRGEEAWASASPLLFVREFRRYFHAMGYPLLRATDYPRLDAFLDAMSVLDDGDLVDNARLQRALDESDRFLAFLGDLFDQISRRDELAGHPFDRRAAAEALKLYLGERPVF